MNPNVLAMIIVEFNRMESRIASILETSYNLNDHSEKHEVELLFHSTVIGFGAKLKLLHVISKRHGIKLDFGAFQELGKFRNITAHDKQEMIMVNVQDDGAVSANIGFRVVNTKGEMSYKNGDQIEIEFRDAVRICTLQLNEIERKVKCT